MDEYLGKNEGGEIFFDRVKKDDVDTGEPLLKIALRVRDLLQLYI